MYSKNLIDFSEINFKSGVPKYKQLINHLIKKIRNNKDEILKYISQELLVRSHYREGAIKSSLNYDEAVLESISILSDTAKYYSILTLND